MKTQKSILVGQHIAVALRGLTKGVGDYSGVANPDTNLIRDREPEVQCNQLPNCADCPSDKSPPAALTYKPIKSPRVTIGELAALAGVSVRTVRYWLKARHLPRRWRARRADVWHIDDVNLWLKTRRRNGAGR
jgi:MerR family regulatory protein